MGDEPAEYATRCSEWIKKKVTENDPRAFSFMCAIDHFALANMDTTEISKRLDYGDGTKGFLDRIQESARSIIDAELTREVPRLATIPSADRKLWEPFPDPEPEPEESWDPYS